MDSWLKAKADQLAQAAQQHVSELQQSASQLTQGALEGALQRTGVLTDSAEARGRKDLRFGTGPLGFRLEGTLVVAVEDGRQAATLGLEVGDRLVAVDGYQVPDFEPGDLEGEQRAKRLIKKWMKEMPRPATLTFRPLTPCAGAEVEESEGATAEAAEVPEVAPLAGRPAGDAPERAAPSPADASASATEEDSWLPLDISSTDLERAALAAAPPPTAEASPLEPSPAESAESAFEVGEVAEDGSFEAECSLESPPAGDALAGVASRDEASLPELPAGKAHDLQAEVQHERGENQKLGAALQEARQALAQSRSSLEAEQQQRVLQQKKVLELQKREKVLADEVTRLGQALQAAVPQSTETALQKAAAAEAQVAELQETRARLTRELQELRERAEAAEVRAAAAEQEVGRLTPQLERFSHVHEAELELLRTEHLEDARRQREGFEGRLAALEERAASELEQARQEAREALELAERHRVSADEATVEAQAAAVEARAARLAEAEASEALEAALGRRRGDSDPMEEGSDEEALHKSVSAPAVGSSGSEDTSALHSRIELLEAQCRRLQRKLQAQRDRPGGEGAADGGTRGPGAAADWEARLASSIGPRAARLLALMHGMFDLALRGFTHRLLKHTLWLYVFYAHLLVLYAISTSCYAQSGMMYSAAPLDSINERMGAVAGAGSRDAG